MNQEQAANPLRVEASPEKRFFISMLTKDIELIPAIIDLVDNSVDGATALRREESFAGLWIRLEASPSRFLIADNCGGISVDLARRYAFRFGRSDSFEGTQGSVGQFGVGMKRALFKLGREFRIESRTETTSFSMTVDVDQWSADPNPDWVFQFDEVHENLERQDDAGTTIEVTRLLDSVAEDFGLSQVIAGLRTDLQLRHQGALERGLTIELNSQQLMARQPVLLMSDAIKPVHFHRSFQQDGDTISLDLYAGVVNGHEDDEADEGDAERFRAPGEAGWYLFCNNRLLLVADRSALTGWGRRPAAYHPQYRRFRGYAYLWAQDSSLLPWNTTKTSVDQDSRVFRWVQSEMESALQNVVAVINRAKQERHDREPSDRPLVAALTAASEVRLRDIPESEKMVVPPPPKAARPDVVSISYKVQRTEYEEAKAELGASSASEVGRQTFSYFYDREVNGS